MAIQQLAAGIECGEAGLASLFAVRVVTPRAILDQTDHLGLADLDRADIGLGPAGAETPLRVTGPLTTPGREFGCEIGAG